MILWPTEENRVKNATAYLTPTTHSTVMPLGKNTEDVGHKPYMDD
jgi:hypothetical protein